MELAAFSLELFFYSYIFEVQPMNSSTSTVSIHPIQSVCLKPLYLDVRTPAEFGSVHIAGARLVPLDRLDPDNLRRDLPSSPVVLVCRSGRRAETAWRKLSAAGIPNLHILEGGMLAWEQSGLPVERGRAFISLERQVRIAAGALVFTGALLALTFQPLWAWLPLAVGAGLMFAGITDTCGMGILLARMPWNQAGAVDTSCCVASTVKKG